MFKHLKNTAFFLCHIPFFIMLISAWGNFEISSLIICAFCIAGSAIAYRLCGSFSEKNSVILQIVLWFVSVVLMICSGWLLAVEPAWDFGRIYHGALDITTNGTLTYTMPYYLESYNNFFITLCLVPWFIVMSVLGIEPLYSGIILNVILMALAQLFAVWAVNIAFSPKDGLFLQLFFTAFVPFYTYAPIFYTDTFSMPFITFVLLVYVVVKEKKVSGKMAPVLYILAGLAAFVGYKLKPTAALVLIAVIIFSVLDNYRENTVNIIAACMTVCICFMGYSVFENRTTLIDLSDIDDYRLPPEHYVMMGLRNKGGYNPDDHYFSLSFDNIDDRKAANVQQIKERMAAYGTTGYIKFLAGKIRYTWFDGTYYASHKLNIDPLRHSIASEIFTEDGEYNEIYQKLMSAVQLSLVLLMLIGSFSRKDITMIASMCVFALFLFLLVWETRSRYIVNFIPLFIILALSGVKHMEEKYSAKEKIAPADIDNSRNMADRVASGA